MSLSNRVEDIMGTVKYWDILQTQMLPYDNEKMPAGWIFQHDNDPQHTSRLVKGWLNDNEVNVLL